MEYQGVALQYYYNYPKVQLANISYDSNNYFASPMNSRAGVATHDNSRYVASTNAYIVNGPHHIYIYHNPGYVQGQKAAQPRAAAEQPRGPLPHRAQSLAAGTCMPALQNHV